MTKRNTSIQINGNHYDALTGALLSFETVPVKTPSKPAAKSIDGVVGGTPRPHPIQTSVARVAAKTSPALSRTAAAHAKAHDMKPSATLMRSAVAKPTTASLKRRSKVQAATRAPSQVALPSHLVVAPKLSLHSVNPQRAARAAAVAMSPRIGKFAHEVSLSMAHDAEQAFVAIDKAIVIPETPITQVSIPQNTSDIFEQALLRATSHEEPAPLVSTKKSRRAARSVRRRMVSFSAGAVAVLALVGVFGYHTENVQFKVAANRAGFAATLPSYQPQGFSVANVQVNSGYLNVRYSNPSVNRSYAVTEKPSFWDNETLLTKITTSDSTIAYTTVQNAGRTVYVYGRNQAAWVNNGILYQVIGNGSLATDEFGQIAASM